METVETGIPKIDSCDCLDTWKTQYCYVEGWFVPDIGSEGSSQILSILFFLKSWGFKRGLGES